MPNFITPVDITPGSSGVWTDTDITPHVGADAGNIGLAIVRAVNESASTVRNAGIRANGSTDGIRRLANNSQTLLYVLVDADDVFELFRAANVRFYLEGYFLASEAGGPVNAIDVTPGSQNSWLDVPISAHTGSDTAVGACLMLNNTSTGTRRFGVRPNGSSDTFDSQIGGGNRMLGAVVSCDATQIFEARRSGGANAFFLLTGWFTSASGYVAVGANRIDYSTATTGLYVDVAPTEVPAGADGALVLLDSNDDNGYGFDLRPKGAAASQLWDARDMAPWIVGVDANGDFQQRIENAALDLYVEGRFGSAAGGAEILPPHAAFALDAFAPAVAGGANVAPAAAAFALAAFAPAIGANVASQTPVYAGLVSNPGHLLKR